MGELGVGQEQLKNQNEKINTASNNRVQLFPDELSDKSVHQVVTQPSGEIAVFGLLLASKENTINGYEG
ncbi:UNVERIFIED_CONTAM: hypothetical protein K2H54_058056 [Gekko kuhli]